MHPYHFFATGSVMPRDRPLRQPGLHLCQSRLAEVALLEQLVLASNDQVAGII